MEPVFLRSARAATRPKLAVQRERACQGADVQSAHKGSASAARSPPLDAVSRAADPASALYYVMVTALAGAMDKSAKQKLGESITSALIAQGD